MLLDVPESESQTSGLSGCWASWCPSRTGRIIWSLRWRKPRQSHRVWRWDLLPLPWTGSFRPGSCPSECPQMSTSWWWYHVSIATHGLSFSWGLWRTQDTVSRSQVWEGPRTKFMFCPIPAVFSWTFWVQEEYVSLNWLIWWSGLSGELVDLDWAPVTAQVFILDEEWGWWRCVSCASALLPPLTWSGSVSFCSVWGNPDRTGPACFANLRLRLRDVLAG